MVRGTAPRGGGEGHRIQSVGFQIPITTARRALARGVLGEVGGQPVFGSSTDLLGRLVADAALGRGGGQRVTFQPGRADQLSLISGDHVLSDSAGENKVGVPPGRGGLR